MDESAKLIETSKLFANCLDPYNQLRLTVLGVRVGEILYTSPVIASLNVNELILVASSSRLYWPPSL